MRIIPVLILIVMLGCGQYRSVYTPGKSSETGLETLPDQGPGSQDPAVPEPQEPMDPVPVDPPPVVDTAEAFFIETGTFQLAHDEALRWDGCSEEQIIQGGYNSDTECGKAFFQPLFAQHLQEYFFRCVSDAAQAAGFLNR